MFIHTNTCTVQCTVHCPYMYVQCAVQYTVSTGIAISPKCEKICQHNVCLSSFPDFPASFANISEIDDFSPTLCIMYAKGLDKLSNFTTLFVRVKASGLFNRKTVDCEKIKLRLAVCLVESIEVSDRP